jgi:hypothetical protein
MELDAASTKMSRTLNTQVSTEKGFAHIDVLNLHLDVVYLTF